MKGILLLIVCLCLLTACRLETQTLREFYDGNLNEVTEMKIVDGGTGYHVTSTDNNIIKDFTSQLENVKFIPDENQEQRDGFIYSITFFQNGEQTFQFGLSQINGNYYHTEPDIKPIVDEYFKSMEIEKK
ncbi:hypothetical protein [Sporosarcina beigongshangi]|uniref:hypothetical protein n=1 Tax=Sporosarcina beigongshangi TaxID=2782538 RepID=UPI0019397389|nr:hypothetical protein [Sporosarcina beigongshangi]